MDLESFDAALPKALRFLRQKEGWTQVDVAEKAGITSSMVSNYERGKERPSLVSLVNLLAGMQMDFIDFGEAIHIFSEYLSEEGMRQRRKPKRDVFCDLLGIEREDSSDPDDLPKWP